MDKIISRIWDLTEGLDENKRKAIDEALSELENLEARVIFDIHNFRRELDRQELMTEELERFIENYVMFDNEF